MIEFVADVRERLLAPRMSAKQESLFAKRLSLLLKSGMDFPSSVRSLAHPRSGKRMQAAFESVASRTESGQRASSVIGNYPRLFSALSRHLISIGEESGTLPESLSFLAEELGKRDRLRAKLLGAFLYPTLLGVLTIVVSGSLVAFVFPKIVPLFSGLGTELPLPTRILLGIHASVGAHWPYIMLSIFALALLSTWAIRQEQIRKRVARTLLRAPIIGNLLASYQLSLLSRSIAILLRSGVALPDALMGAASASGNLPYQDALRGICTSIERGEGIREAVSAHPRLFPSVAADILSAGEMGGGLYESALHLADYYEHEFEEATHRLSVLVEPILMILMGLIVGFVAIAMILPIYAITDGLNAH